jgi:hypothetical protein
MPNFSQLRLAFEACCHANENVVPRIKEAAALLPLSRRVEVRRELLARFAMLKLRLSPSEREDWVNRQVDILQQMARCGDHLCHGCGVAPCECALFAA